MGKPSSLKHHGSEDRGQARARGSRIAVPGGLAAVERDPISLYGPDKKFIAKVCPPGQAAFGSCLLSGGEDIG